MGRAENRAFAASIGLLNPLESEIVPWGNEWQGSKGRQYGNVHGGHEWSMNWTSARLNLPNLFFALVDLKEFEELPDIFIVPSAVIFAYYEGGDPATWKWPRYHEDISKLAPYKNAFSLLLEHLNGSQSK